MKKLFALGLVLLLSLTFLVACDNDPTETETEVTPPVTTTDTETEVDPTEDVDPTEPGTTFGGEDFLIWVDDEAFAEALIPALENRFPDTNFEWAQMGHVYTIENLSLDGPGGTGADLIFFPHDHITRAVNDNLVLPVGPAISEAMEANLHAAPVQLVHSGDFHWGVPVSTESVAFFYNRTLLDELGFEPATTWEQVFEQGAEFNDVANNQFIVQLDVGNAFMMHFSTTAHGFRLFGPTHLDPDAVNLNTPETIAGLEWLRTVREELLPVPAADLNGDDIVAAFIDGGLPYIIGGPWMISNILENGDFELGITSIPTIDGNQPLTFTGNQVAAISSFTDYADLGRAVLEFLMSDEGFGIMYEYRGWIPTLIDGSGVSGLADNPYHRGILAQANYSHPMPIIPEMGHFWDAAPGMYSAAWDGILTPAEAAEEAELEFDTVRAAAGE